MAMFQKPGNGPFQLQEFFPYRINLLADAVSQALAQLYVQRFGLSRPEWRVLATLGARSAMTAKDIGLDSVMEKMQVSRALARMERDGLVTRAADPDDRRSNILRLTRRGRALFRKIVPLAQAREDYLLSVLTPDERAGLERIMGKLEEQADELLKRG